MFQTLLESAAHPSQARAGWTTASIAWHAAIIAVAIARTMDREPVSPRPSVEPVFLVTPRAPQPELRRAPSSKPGVLSAVARGGLAIPVPQIPGRDLQPSAGTIIPDGEWGSGLAAAPGVASPSTEPYAESHVDRAVQPSASNGSPAYPSPLRASALEGTVIAHFVVDTLGIVEAGSVEIIDATHPLFAAAVRQWLRRTRYAPAEIAGRRVRQLVEQRVSFSIRR